ncbi:MAG: UbiH/UbiF/VisC/COQ6 family ubiquinone biosynthesis hydroxylase [Gammaproteobacteria bacterium]|nr:UbiH/UbiF/VisC/COQ6 family ubiquinone biosynthesis hydroxylase [Gammaproteobacteria bacterium]
MIRADVAVVGGGMVGAALATLLAEGGLEVAVIEPVPPRPPDETLDLRVSAIAPASRTLLAALGAWEPLAAQACAYTAMEVWDGVGDGRVRFTADEAGVPELGHIVENRAIQHALWLRLGELPGARRLAPARVAGLLVCGATAQLELEDGRLVEAALVVAADGARSRVRGWAGLDSVGWDYGQKTIVGNLRTAEPHGDACWQRFLPTGPVAFLPLADGRCSLAWHATRDYADHLLALDDAAFAAELEVASGGALGTIEELGPRGAFPLRLQHALRYVAPRVALVGDAAHAIHPLAGQGVNLGFRDVRALGERLLEGSAGGRDPGDLALLRDYEQARLPDNGAMLLAMDAFKKGFGTAAAPLRRLRNLGLDAAHRAGPLKRAVMRRAMGLEPG